jgi:hypothetical protein
MAYPSDIRGSLQHWRDTLNTGNASTTQYPDSEYGLLQNIRDLLNTGSASTAQYPKDMNGLITNIRDLLNSGSSSVAKYTANKLGLWQAIQDLSSVTSDSPPSIYGITTALGRASNTPAPPFDSNWYQSYNIGGTNPSFVLDFLNGRYYDGSSSQAAMASMVSGGTRDANGLLLNSASINAIGAALTAMKLATVLICAEVGGGTAAANAGIVSFDTTQSPIFQVSTNKARSYRSTATPTGLDTTNTATWTGVNRIASQIATGGRSITLNNVNRVSDTNVPATPTSVFLGSFNGGSLFGGYLRCLYAIPLGVTINGGLSGALPPAYVGSSGLYFPANGFVDLGNVLQYERTQAWSFGCGIVGLNSLGATANVLATNVTTSTAFPGIDFMFIGGSNNSPAGSAGRIFVRLINDITSKWIGVYGSTRVDDGKMHYLWTTYDGSGTAAGVKLYVDGVLETMTVESDTLGANSIVAAGQDLYIGNQKNHLDFPANCVLGGLRISNIVRSASYVAQYSTSASIAPVDASTVLAMNFAEGTGTTTADSSASGFTGTITSAPWCRAN